MTLMMPLASSVTECLLRGVLGAHLCDLIQEVGALLNGIVQHEAEEGDGFQRYAWDQLSSQESGSCIQGIHSCLALLWAAQDACVYLGVPEVPGYSHMDDGDHGSQSGVLHLAGYDLAQLLPQEDVDPLCSSGGLHG